MHEPNQPPSQESDEEPPKPSLEQMVHDLWEVEYGGKYPLDLERSIGIGGSDYFAERYGYPDPRRTAYRQLQDAYSRGEELPPPLTPESMARDVYNYELDRKRAGEGQPVRSFEERFGYPDPRQHSPKSTETPMDDSQ